MRVEISDHAWAQLTELPLLVRSRVAGVLERLATWPNVSGVKWLTGEWKHHARIRTGDYRVIFHLVPGGAILIDRIAHRRDVYAE